jgi:excisionase family DNA binding protein
MSTHRFDVSSGQKRPLPAWIPNPDEHPTITVSDASRIAGVARRTGYAAAQRGEWPTVRTGRAVRIRTQQFLELCGFLADAA